MAQRGVREAKERMGRMRNLFFGNPDELRDKGTHFSGNFPDGSKWIATFQWVSRQIQKSFQQPREDDRCGEEFES